MAKLAQKTYGQALFDLSVERDCVASYAEESAMIRGLLAEMPDLMKLLTHPRITVEEKLSVITQSFKGRISDDMTAFLEIVVRAGRQQVLPGILEDFEDRVRAYRHIGVAEVTTAVPLTDDQKHAVEEKLLATTDFASFEMHYNVDPGLIGGMVIRIGDKVADSSVRTRIDNLSRQLMDIRL